MQFWIGRPNFGHRQMLFATQGGRPSEVPHAVIHTPHAGLFVRDEGAPGAYFACDRCGLALKLRITDGYDPSPTEVRQALEGVSAEEVVSSAARHAPGEITRDEHALATYPRGARGDQASEGGRPHVMKMLDEIEATPMEDDLDG